MDHEEQPINEIVLPLLNVSRRLPDNTVNPNEPNQQQIMCTSAGVKTSFAFDKLIDVLKNQLLTQQKQSISAVIIEFLQNMDF